MTETSSDKQQSPWEQARPFDKLSISEMEQLVQKAANGVLGLAVEIKELQRRKNKLIVQMRKLTGIISRRKKPKLYANRAEGLVLYNLGSILHKKAFPGGEPEGATWYIVNRTGWVAVQYEFVLRLLDVNRRHYNSTIQDIHKVLTCLRTGAKLVDFRLRARGLRHYKDTSRACVRNFFLARREPKNDAPLPEKIEFIEAKYGYRQRQRQKAPVHQDSGPVQSDKDGAVGPSD